jgi:hypothetical protein
MAPNAPNCQQFLIDFAEKSRHKRKRHRGFARRSARLLRP